MGIFGKGKSKQSKFDFYIHVHTLSPWPAQYSKLTLEWQRGGSRKGWTKPIGPTVGQPGRMWATYEIEQTFHVPCTLYQEGKARPGQLGPFDKKWLMVAVQDLETKASAGKEPLGRVVINLADFASEDGRATQAFTVACSRSISAAVGEAKLLVTIGCVLVGGKGGRDILSTMSSQQSSGFETAGAETDDDRSESGSYRSTPQSSIALSSAAAARAAFPPREAGHARQPSSEQYDEDGFLLDSDAPSSPQASETVSATAPSASARPSAALRLGGAAGRPDTESDVDSEDEMLSRAVNAMEQRKDLPPVLPGARSLGRPSAVTSPFSATTRPLITAPLQQQDRKLQSSSSAPRERRFAPASAAPASAAAGVDSPVSPVVDPSTNPFADKAPAPETNPFLDPSLATKNASAGRLSEDDEDEDEKPGPNPFISDTPTTPVTPADLRSSTFSSSRSLPAAVPAFSAAESRAQRQSLATPGGSWKPRGSAHTRIGSREAIFYDDDAEAKATPFPSSDRVERGATPRKLAHEGLPATYASVPSGLPGTQSLPPPRPVPIPGLIPPAFPGAPRPSAPGPWPSAPDALAAARPNGDAAAGRGFQHTAVKDVSELPVRAKMAMLEKAAAEAQTAPPQPAAAAAAEPSSRAPSNPPAPALPESARLAAALASPQLLSAAVAVRAKQTPEPTPTASAGLAAAPSSPTLLAGSQVSKLRAAILHKPEPMSDSASASSMDEGPTDEDMEDAPKEAMEQRSQSRPSTSGPARSASPQSRTPQPRSPHPRSPLSKAPIVDPFDEVFGSRSSSPDRGAQHGREQAAEAKRSSPEQGRGAYGAGADARPGSAEPAQSGRPGIEPRKSILSEEDREDLRMFEEGVSSPTPMHTAWSAAASSLQMRHALPEESGTPNGDTMRGRAEPNALAAGGLTDPNLNPLVERLQRELRTVAALEAAVYTVRAGKGGARRVKARSCHAPARRLARTTISLGPEEGILFGLRAIRAVEAAAEASADVVGRAFWWSNCIQLRWMLWAMSHGGSLDNTDLGLDTASAVDDFDWVMQVLVPPLRELEAYVFEQLLRQLWRGVLIEATLGDSVAGAAAARPFPASHRRHATREETAVLRWLQALQGVQRALLPAGGAATSGHVTLLKQKVLTAILRRLDGLLFGKLLAGESDGGDASARDGASVWSGDLDSLLSDGNISLDPDLLPFPRGRFSFGVGVNLKMAVSRWTNWAADVGIREENMGAEEGYMLFPCLRATADLLMMPKEVLTDRAIRAEVVPGLSLRRICQLLQRFLPDDFAPDPLPPGLLEALHNETPSAEPVSSPTSKLHSPYEPISEAELLADGLIEPVSLEMDDESEDEVEALAEMYDPDCSSDGTYRFALLRELWASAR